MAAIQNQIREGNSNINNVHKKLQITEAIKDFFLQKVSHNTEVGNSNIHIQKVKIFDTNTISKVDNPVYL
jgi:hypothetical protein